MYVTVIVQPRMGRAQQPQLILPQAPMIRKIA